MESELECLRRLAVALRKELNDSIGEVDHCLGDSLEKSIDHLVDWESRWRE